MLKRFVCLAKSAREGAWCIAGKEIKNNRIGKWFRPVGRASEALDRCGFDIGDIISCEVDKYMPNSTQPENYRLAENPHWHVEGKLRTADFEKCVDTPASIWMPSDSSPYDNSSFHGVNDKVHESLARQMDGSLLFIKPQSPAVCKVYTDYDNRPKIRLRLYFEYNDITYYLSITAPSLGDKYWHSLEIGGKAEIGPCYITLSLGRAFSAYCYKLVAGYVEK